VDIDRFIADRQTGWARLAELAPRASKRGTRGLTAEESDELVRRYQQASAHLALARSRFADPDLVAMLSDLVARAGASVYGTPARTSSGIVGLFSVTFPAAIWHLRRYVLVATLATLLPAAAVATWIANSDAALEATGPTAARAAYVEEDFEAYYSSAPAAEFASSVFTNNARVGIVAFALGIGLGLPTLAILAVNGANLGVAAGLFAAVGEQARFWGLILPHGLLEITAVCVAGGTGLALGWALVDPGDRSRAEALSDQGRRAVVVVAGLVLVFLVAGLIEGFVTGSRLPTGARVGIGATVEMIFLGYAVVLGRAAASRGFTGAATETDPLRVAFGSERR